MFADLLRKTASSMGNRVAIRSVRQTLSYAELYERSCRLANALADGGLMPGDRVASLGRNQLHSMEEISGVAMGGLVRAPLYMQDTAERQAFMIDRVGAKALIVDADCWPGLRDALTDHGELPPIVLVRSPDGGSTFDIDYEDALQNASQRDPGVETSGDDLY
ncbi:MAG: AMP-binding protein, partial [Parasphingopyxis sp.]|uniref:AMP-binding protein n=1 Tax=Parasphingopyxis sp. TaxID=1920299 RepID=UPI0032EAA3B4